MPELGWDSVTVPGAVSGWRALAERFGALPFERLFEPAIAYADEGYLLSAVTAVDWASAAAEYTNSPDFAAAFLPGGRVPAAGEVIRFGDHARTLAAIAASGGEAFYRGELAERIVAHARAAGAPLSEQDLAEHEPLWVRPLSIDYGGVRVHELPPNGQGVAALMALGIAARTPAAESPADSADAIHLQIEAMKLAFADAHRHVADADAMRVAPQDLLAPAYLAERARLIDPHRAVDPGHGEPRPGGTVYLTAADAQGRMVSLIQSNFMWFGSGIVVPGTGIALQNRACGFSTERDHPNSVAPGKRPFHTIIPAMLSDERGAFCALGLVGGPMQPQGHLQVISRLVDRGENPQAALDAPRWRVTAGLNVAVEEGFPQATIAELRARGHDVVVQPRVGLEWQGFGAGQIAMRLGDGYVAASDYRKDGFPVGY
jgi:gamma-glutamyltranspeptidase/glutathione hydrolase